MKIILKLGNRIIKKDDVTLEDELIASSVEEDETIKVILRGPGVYHNTPRINNNRRYDNNNTRRHDKVNYKENYTVNSNFINNTKDEVEEEKAIEAKQTVKNITEPNEDISAEEKAVEAKETVEEITENNESAEEKAVEAKETVEEITEEETPVNNSTEDIIDKYEKLYGDERGGYSKNNKFEGMEEY